MSKQQLQLYQIKPLKYNRKITAAQREEYGNLKLFWIVDFGPDHCIQEFTYCETKSGIKFVKHWNQSGHDVERGDCQNWLVKNEQEAIELVEEIYLKDVLEYVTPFKKSRS